MTFKIDKIDLSILKDLQKDGRLTNVELAKRAGISAPPCLRRIKALESNGVVLSYHASINAQALGFNIIIFAEVTLVSQNDADMRSFESEVVKWSLVRECYMVTGGSDFLLKIIARNFDEYQTFLSSTLSTMPKVTHINTRMVIRSTKEVYGLPLETL